MCIEYHPFVLAVVLGAAVLAAVVPPVAVLAAVVPLVVLPSSNIVLLSGLYLGFFANSLLIIFPASSAASESIMNELIALA